MIQRNYFHVRNAVGKLILKKIYGAALKIGDPHFTTLIAEGNHMRFVVSAGLGFAAEIMIGKNL